MESVLPLSLSLSFLQQVQEKDVVLSTLKEEMSQAVEQIELLTSQLDDARKKSDPASVNAQLKQVHVHVCHSN